MTTAALYTIMSMDDKSQLTKFSVFYCTYSIFSHVSRFRKLNREEMIAKLPDKSDYIPSDKNWNKNNDIKNQKHEHKNDIIKMTTKASNKI